MDTKQGPQDKELIQSLRNGETRYHEVLWLRSRGLMIGIAKREFGLSYEDAEELFCKVFLEVIKKFRSYDPQKSKLSTWMAAITRNRAKDWKRQHEKDNLEVLKDDEWWAKASDEALVAEPEFETRLDPGTCKLVDQCLTQMNERDRQILLYGIDGHSREEIAEWAGLKDANAARVAYHRARERFRKLFESVDVRS